MLMPGDVLKVVTRWLLLLMLGQYISDAKRTVYSDRIQAAHTSLPCYPSSNSYFLGKREDMLDVKDEVERWKSGETLAVLLPKIFGGEWLGRSKKRSG